MMQAQTAPFLKRPASESCKMSTCSDLLEFCRCPKHDCSDYRKQTPFPRQQQHPTLLCKDMLCSLACTHTAAYQIHKNHKNCDNKKVDMLYSLQGPLSSARRRRTPGFSTHDWLPPQSHDIRRR